MTRGASWILKHESRTQCPVGSPSNFAGLNKLFTLFEPQVAFSHIDGEDLVGLQGVEVYCTGCSPGAGDHLCSSVHLVVLSEEQ